MRSVSMGGTWWPINESRICCSNTSDDDHTERPGVNPRGVCYETDWSLSDSMSDPAYVPQRASYGCFR